MGTQVAIGADSDQAAPLGQPVHRLAQVVASHTFDFVRARHQGVERAVLLQPLGRRLGADFFHPRHVVHGVADQGLVVDHQLRRDAKLGAYTRHVTALAAHGVDDGDVRINQLRQVLVAAGDDDGHALARSRLRQRADDVVGLDPRHHQHRPAEQAHDFVDGLDLGPQVLRHGCAVRLVRGVPGVAEGRPLGVKDAGAAAGGVVLAQALQHVDDAAYGAGGGAGRIAGDGAQVRHGVKGAVQVAGTIDQQQRLGGVLHARIVPGAAPTIGLFLCTSSCPKRDSGAN